MIVEKSHLPLKNGKKFLYSLCGKRIFVAGHNGMVGSAVVRALNKIDCSILTAERQELDLLRQTDVEAWMASNKPDVVVITAAKVGGILANKSYPADFLYNNTMIEFNLIAASHLNDVEKLLFLGSSCIYPKYAEQPISEDALLTGPLEPTNKWYAIAKIAGVKLCQAYREQHGRDFISAMPTNLYGTGDNYDLQSSHVLPALVRKFSNAVRTSQKSVEIWGSGEPLREFMHADDLADALVYLLSHYSESEPINVGSGEEVSIFDLAKMVSRQCGFSGEIILDSSKPDGAPRKLMDSSKLASLGWRPKIDLASGLAKTIQEFNTLGNSEKA